MSHTSLSHLTNLKTMLQVVVKLIRHANLQNKASVQLIQYYIFSRLDSDDKSRFSMLALYTEFCLRMQDNQYFDTLKDLIEEEVANNPLSASQLNLVVGLLRKVAKCQTTEYSTKFIDLLQGILGLLNRPVSELSVDEKRLLENCIGMLKDMVEDQVL